MNIWEVVCVSDLIKILKTSPQQFIIVGIVLDSTPKELQTTIKRFLKSKAKSFPNMKFLFFKASQKDLGKISFLETDETQYPFIYHIFDTSNIFIKVNCANQSTINEAFKEGEQYYRKDLERFLLENNTRDDRADQEENNDQVEQADNNRNKTTKPSKPSQPSQASQPSQPEINHEEWKLQQTEMESQQKNIEKIITLQQRAKDFNVELLKDIKLRKIEESKIKKKL
jgi:flagellar biosynthesis GTPase FlhF